jgi:hypothetical protein
MVEHSTDIAEPQLMSGWVKIVEQHFIQPGREKNVMEWSSNLCSVAEDIKDVSRCIIHPETEQRDESRSKLRSADGIEGTADRKKLADGVDEKRGRDQGEYIAE